jgi:hypothetical protein
MRANVNRLLRHGARGLAKGLNVAALAEPDGRISRIRLFSQWGTLARGSGSSPHPQACQPAGLRNPMELR